MNLLTVLFLLAGLLALGVLFFLFQYFLQKQIKEGLGHFVETANERFIHEQTKSKAIFEQNKQSIDFQVERLNTELVRLTEMVKDFENSRIEKFATLDEKLAQAARATSGLSEVTSQLSSVIGNNQLRGQWGQRMAEDILRAAGLEEGVNYVKEKSQDTLSTRPDYMIFLPDQHKVYMDVKFPLNNYLEFMGTTDKDKQDHYLADFIRDVKNRIRELKKREYINPEEQTLDYLILFIPNEQVFGFIHRNAPGIMDEALAQKIILTSPYSLFGVLSVIRQAYDNFYFKKSAHEILKLIGQFLEDYENFKKRFLDLGESLEKTKEKYLEVSEKSFKKLDLRIRKLEDFRKGEEKTVIVEPGHGKEFILQ